MHLLNGTNALNTTHNQLVMSVKVEAVHKWWLGISTSRNQLKILLHIHKRRHRKKSFIFCFIFYYFSSFGYQMMVGYTHKFFSGDFWDGDATITQPVCTVPLVESFIHPLCPTFTPVPPESIISLLGICVLIA